MNEITQVYVITSGEYSDYGINSVWLTLEEAKAAAGSDGTVEVWPIGENKRTLGSFSHSCQIDFLTGVQSEYSASDYPALPGQEEARVICWPGRSGKSVENKLGIRVTADTQERADKIFSEVKARVLTEISQGLPIEAIAGEKYVSGVWSSTR
jgi:hypothetical protein